MNALEVQIVEKITDQLDFKLYDTYALVYRWGGVYHPDISRPLSKWRTRDVQEAYEILMTHDLVPEEPEIRRWYGHFSCEICGGKGYTGYFSACCECQQTGDNRGYRHWPESMQALISWARHGKDQILRHEEIALESVREPRTEKTRFGWSVEYDRSEKDTFIYEPIYFPQENNSHIKDCRSMIGITFLPMSYKGKECSNFHTISS